MLLLSEAIPQFIEINSLKLGKNGNFNDKCFLLNHTNITFKIKLPSVIKESLILLLKVNQCITFLEDNFTINHFYFLFA